MAAKKRFIIGSKYHSGVLLKLVTYGAFSVQFISEETHPHKKGNG
jgi:hypothetical protein